MATPSRIDALLAQARAGLDRVGPEDLDAELAAGALVVDVRPVDQRQRDGDLPGAVVIDRNVLEWRLDPSSPFRIAEMASADRRVIVVCNEGYSSSLAAATLRQLGLHRASDLAGGFQAWLAHRSGAAGDAAQGALDTVRSFQAAWSDHDLEAAMGLITVDCVFESTSPPPEGLRVTGRQAIRAAWQPLFDDPSSRFEVEETFGVGDQVVQRWRYSWDGGHVRGVDLFTVRGGLVSRKLSYVKG